MDFRVRIGVAHSMERKLFSWLDQSKAGMALEEKVASKRRKI
jgi:hypothetical protein